MTDTVPFLVPTGVGWTTAEDAHGSPQVFVAPLPHGPVAVLDGTAALIWLAATQGGPGTVADRVAVTAEVSVEEIRSEVEHFVEQLVQRGLLRQE